MCLIQSEDYQNVLIELFKMLLILSETNTKISIPSVVFVEIFEIWLREEEFAKKFYYEVFVPIIQSPNI